MAELHDEHMESERLRARLQVVSVESDTDFEQLQALAEAYLAQPDVPDVDTDAAWERMLCLTEPEPPHVRVHSHRAFCAAVAAAVAAGLLFVLAAVALAMPAIRETVGRWSDEIFLSDVASVPPPDAAAPSVSDDLDAALSAAGVTELVVPHWFPNGATLEMVTYEVCENGSEVTAALSNGEGSMTISRGELGNMQAADPAVSALQYTVGGVRYSISTDTEHTLVYWNTDQCFCRIELVGALSVSDIQKMIDSIYN